MDLPLAAIESYNVWQALHILAAVTWVGGALAIQLIYSRMKLSGDGLPNFLAAVEWVGMRFFIGSSLVLVVTGFIMVGQADWGWDPWIVFGLVVWAISFLTGAFFLGPESGRLAKLAEERGFEDPEVQSRRGRLLTIARFELVLLVLVILAMTIKP